ncbi:hypothetical protein ACFV7Q_05605 [Streptomyces sp. NPDC059851]|uniref:hypothetical protein n=1 Tax=Streptomyces sp. NPDC059851 TaxID=3346971 RepID=UPI00366A0F26
MSLSTLYTFLSHDLLGDVVAASLVAGIGYLAKKIRASARNRNDRTRRTRQ